MKIEINVTPTLKESIILLAAKRTMLKKIIGNITTVVLGSSHGDYGFNPSYFPRSFNLCCRSQDLKHTFYLHRHVTQKTTIKNIVIFYSIFSPGYFMEDVRVEQEICPAINELYNLGIPYHNDVLLDLSNRIRGKLDSIDVILDGFNGFFPVAGKVSFDESYGAQRRANDHLKFIHSDRSLIYLVRSILLAKRYNQKLFIVLPPVREDYKTCLRMNCNSLFKSLFDVLQNYHLDYPVEIINAFDDDLFRKNDFADYDHLLPSGNGTKRLSEMIAAQCN